MIYPNGVFVLIYLYQQLFINNCLSTVETTDEPAPDDAGDWYPTGGRGDNAGDNTLQISCEDSKTDLIFALDGSSSVGSDGFRALKDFLRNIVHSFKIVSQDTVRVGMVQYNEAPECVTSNFKNNE